jgi:hypothetical protein
MKKILLIIISVITLFLISFCLGLFSQFNYFTAQRDIKSHIVRNICVNEHPDWVNVQNEVGKKYGITFKDIYTWRNYTPINIVGINIYNKLMTSELKRKIGIKSYKKYLIEMDSMLRITIVK